MYTVALTSIPPRFHRLGPVLQTILQQDPAPEQVLLCLPDTYRRFPGRFAPPVLPDGVEVLRTPVDLGPITKAVVPARHLAGSGKKLIYCDDDWLLPPTWAASLLAAHEAGAAVTGQGFGIERLGRISANMDGEGLEDIAQGFSGVLVNPDWLAGPELDPPEPAWAVDDIWISGHLAWQGVSVRAAPAARMGMRAAYDDAHALQTLTTSGLTRDAANRICASLLNERYGIWPEMV